MRDRLKVTDLYDDIDGVPNAKERHFSIGENHYAIDLIDENYHKLMIALTPYISNGTLVSKRKERTNYAPVLNKEDRSKIRAWAVANGRYVPARGRFPADLVRDYYADIQAEPKEFVYG